MKHLICLWMLLLLTPSAAWSQDFMESMMQTAQMENEANAQEEGQPNEGTNSEAAETWEAELERMRESTPEFFASLDTKYLKCVAMMESYVYMYLKLVREHKLGDMTLSACDAYGMQTLAMASSTTFMYCAEGMEAPELNEEEKTDLMMDYIHKLTGFQELINHYVYSYYFDLVQSNFPNTPASAETMNHNYLVYLMEFFRPRYIIPQSLKIDREMEALGCSG